MNHYTYCIMHKPTGYFYVGVRSSVQNPDVDHYWGSGQLLWKAYNCQGFGDVHFRSGESPPPEWEKYILATYDSRVQACTDESCLISSVLQDEKCLNKAGFGHDNVDAAKKLANVRKCFTLRTWV